MSEAAKVVTETSEGTEQVLEQNRVMSSMQAFLDKILGEEKETEDEGEKKPDDTKKYEQGDVKVITSEDVSKIVAEALKAEREKWDAEIEEKEKISKLPPEEQEKAEKAETAKKIAELESQLLIKELKEKAVDDLSKGGYPVELSSILNYTSEDEMSKSLATVKNVFKTSLAEVMNQKLKGKVPEGLVGKNDTTINDQIAKAIKGGF